MKLIDWRQWRQWRCDHPDSCEDQTMQDKLGPVNPGLDISIDTLPTTPLLTPHLVQSFVLTRDHWSVTSLPGHISDMKPVCSRFRCKTRHFIGRQWQWMRSANSPVTVQPGWTHFLGLIKFCWRLMMASWRVVRVVSDPRRVYLIVCGAECEGGPGCSIIWHTWYLASPWSPVNNNNHPPPLLCKHQPSQSH